jgi:hypothetical protein
MNSLFRRGANLDPVDAPGEHAGLSFIRAGGFLDHDPWNAVK